VVLQRRNDIVGVIVRGSFGVVMAVVVVLIVAVRHSGMLLWSDKIEGVVLVTTLFALASEVVEFVKLA